MINSDIHKISKSKKVNNLWQKLSEQQNMKFINYVYLREKEAYNNKWNIFLQCASKRRLGLFVQMIRYLRWFSFKDIYSRKK